MESMIKQKPALLFSFLTIIFTFGVYFLPLPREALPFLMVLVPALLAIVLTALLEGRAGIGILLGRLTQWRITIKWFLIAIGVAFLMRLAVSIMAILLGYIDSIRLRPLRPVEVVIFALIFIIAALPEELGWRGFALPPLLANHSPLFAGLLLGFFWGLVHLALHLPGMPSAGQPWIATILQLVGLSVLLTWFYVNGGMNIVLTSIFHASQSFFVIINDGITISQQTWLMASVWMGTALIIVLIDPSIRKTPG